MEISQFFPTEWSLRQEQAGCARQLEQHAYLAPLMNLDDFGWRVLYNVLKDRLSVKHPNTTRMVQAYLTDDKNSLTRWGLFTCLHRQLKSTGGLFNNISFISFRFWLAAGRWFTWQPPATYAGYDEGLDHLRRAVLPSNRMVVEPSRGPWYLSISYASVAIVDQLLFEWLYHYTPTSRTYVSIREPVLYFVAPHQPDQLSRGVNVVVITFDLRHMVTLTHHYQLFVPSQWGQNQQNRRLMVWTREIRAAQFEAVQTVIIPDLARIIVDYMGSEKEPATLGFTGSAAFYAHQ